jgi:hypothetical protein
MATPADVRRVALLFAETDEGNGHLAFAVRNQGKAKGRGGAWRIPAAGNEVNRRARIAASSTRAGATIRTNAPGLSASRRPRCFV